MRSQLLPLFPLGAVLYPHAQLPLHIFEDRYKEMVRYCLEDDRPFGVVLFHDGSLADVGCMAKITRVLREYDDGRMDILVTGERRFRLMGVVDERAYLEATVRRLPERTGTTDPTARERAITQHMKLLELGGRLPSPVMYQDRPLLSYLIAHNAGLTLEQKQQVLELPDERRRIDFLVDHMEAFIPQVEKAEDLRRKIRSNGHFPDFPLDAGDPAQDTPDA